MIQINQEKMLKIESDKINTSIQEYLDNTAKQFRFDNIKSARSQAGKNIPSNTNKRVLDKMTSIVNNANKLADWELECWATVAIIEEDVLAGTRPMPTIEELLAELHTNVPLVLP